MSNSNDHNLDNLRPVIVAMMREELRDFDTCEYCKGSTNGKWEIHHTKYDGATYKDLMIVCRSCNRIDENLGLA